LRHGTGERAGVVHPHVGRCLNSGRRQKLFLGETILANGQRLGARPDKATLRKGRRGARRNVLEFKGDELDLARELRQRHNVFIRRDRSFACDVECRAIGVLRVNMAPEPEFRGCQGEHAPQLAAAQNPNRRTWNKIE
jgi:hypothetical protein